MKKILIVCIAAILLFACNAGRKLQGKAVTENNKLSFLKGSWQLQSLFASDNNWSKPPSISINVNEKTFSGNSSCNSISGKFTLADNYIAFDKNIISTKMSCNNVYENEFLSALLKINTYFINKNDLELGQGEIVLMKFKRIN